ncbi:MAG: phage tail protein [Betaproteobacteria bacterium]|jgi:phage tail-like protein|nr:phage tail protein [Rhodocyclaceae bacterium]MCA3136067.1 phage tail protein [Rhodocyclaceae bacterium]MCA3141041.1 phage tail protein [Rhodocyclaceae bacterium]MCA3146163.1 phage tail protein [Rhodocyclaceae bacterium]MCE2898292.1 phage tail protein [Betaproteobacteria bacterium]
MAAETRGYPFTAFNFEVRIRREGESAPLCGGAFAECDGLDMTMEVKTIRQGGDNRRQIRLTGPAAFGQLTLKRGMTKGFDLWKWFSATLDDPGLRADAEVVLFAADGSSEQARFVLSRCIPVKLKTPALNAREGVVAVEELQLAYETVSLPQASR